jgi:hypothetical protein
MSEHERPTHGHMSHEHVSDDVLIDGLYGLVVDVEARIGSCAVCEARWSAALERRATLAAPMAIPPGVLAAQRRSIYSRIEHPVRFWEKPGQMRWAGPAIAGAAAACVLAIGLVLRHPVAPVTSTPPVAAAVEAQPPIADVYSDVYSMEQSFEPSASASLRVLFEADGSQADRADQGAKQ